MADHRDDDSEETELLVVDRRLEDQIANAMDRAVTQPMSAVTADDRPDEPQDDDYGAEEETVIQSSPLRGSRSAADRSAAPQSFELDELRTRLGIGRRHRASPSPSSDPSQSAVTDDALTSKIERPSFDALEDEPATLPGELKTFDPSRQVTQPTPAVRPAPADDSEGPTLVTDRSQIRRALGESQERAAPNADSQLRAIPDGPSQRSMSQQVERPSERSMSQQVERPSERSMSQQVERPSEQSLVSPAARVQKPIASSAADTNEQLERLGLVRKKRPNANHVPANSGFYSLPEANPKPDELERSPGQRFAAAVIAACGTGFLAGAAVLALAIGRWMPPMEPLMWAAVGAVPLVIVVSMLIGAPNKNRTDIAEWFPVVIPTLLGSVLAVGMAGMWHLGEVRTLLRPLAGQGVDAATRVLADQHDPLVLGECLAIAPQYDISMWRNALVNFLSSRSAVSKACLEQTPDDVTGPLSATLADRWQRQLLEGSAEPERACEITSSMVSLPRPSGEIEARLLGCVLTAPTAGTQRCCGEALAAHTGGSADWIEDILKMDDYVPDEGTAAGLMALAYHRQGISPSQLQFVKAARFEGATAERVAATFACASIRDGAAGLAQHFGASLEGKCDLDVADLPAGRETWLEVCEIADASIADAEDPRQLLCESTKTALVRDAVGNASRIIQGAIVNPKQARDLSDAMLTNYSDRPSDKVIKDATSEWMNRWQNQAQTEQRPFYNEQ